MKQFDLSELKLELLSVFDANGDTIANRLRYHYIDSKTPTFVLIIPEEGDQYRVKYRDCVCTIYGELNLNTISTALEFCGFHPATLYNRVGKIDNLLA